MKRLFLINCFHSALSESVTKLEVKRVRKWNIGVKSVIKRQLKHFWEALWSRMKRKIKPVLRKWFSFIPPKNVRKALVILPVWKWNIARHGLRYRFYIWRLKKIDVKQYYGGRAGSYLISIFQIYKYILNRKNYISNRDQFPQSAVIFWNPQNTVSNR